MPSAEPVWIVDAHNDLALELAHRATEANPFAEHWLPLLDAGHVLLTVCAVYAGSSATDASARAVELIHAVQRAVAGNDSRVVGVRDAADVRRLRTGSRLGLMLGLEGLEPLGNDPFRAVFFHGLGVRSFGLTWNTGNAFAHGIAERDDAGLTSRGVPLLECLSSLPAVVDLAHASPRTIDDALNVLPAGRAYVSHAGCRAIWDTPRNLDDRQLRALADHGGVLGVMAHPLTVDPELPTIQRMVDHIDHAVASMGPAHVAIGPDFIRQVARVLKMTSKSLGLPESIAPDAAIEDLEGPSDFPHLVNELERRGYDAETVGAITAGNLLRFFGRALDGDATR